MRDDEKNVTKSDFCWEKVGGKAERNLHFNDLRRLKTPTRTEKIEIMAAKQQRGKYLQKKRNINNNF